MTDSTQTQHSYGHGGGGSRYGCDPDSLDAIKCRAKGLQARADYNKAHLEALGKARDQYDAARAAYTAARTAATPLVNDTKTEIDKLIENRLGCLISPDEETRERIVTKIKRAFAEVQARIQECGSKTGCYLRDDCDFDVSGCQPKDAPARLADITRRTARAEAAFTDLIAIPAAMSTAVTKLQGELTTIQKGIGEVTDKTPLDVLIQLYAAALVAQQHATDIWRGFENVNEFVDCVCHALTCMLRGHTAIAILTGILAVKTCQRESREADCARLRDKTADEVYAAYLRNERASQGSSQAPTSSPSAAQAPAGGGNQAGAQTDSERQATRERNDREYFAG
ncbi:MAG TPA: hypothetical protein VIT65_16805 [Microlunatus sp.]